MAETSNELRSLSDAELLKRYDSVAPSTNVGLNHYREELKRRDDDRAAKESHELNVQIAKMT